ncbi:hypothetical protein D3C72_1997950 [compost metagenome]
MIFWESADGWVDGSLLPKIGDASYSLYLLQTLTIPAFARLLAGVDKLRILPGDIACLLLVAATVMVSVLVYRVLERTMDVKLREWRRNFRDIHMPAGTSEDMVARPVQRDRGL